MADQRHQMVARLWEAHLQAQFPARLRGAEVVGVEMILLDADTAGCVKSWLDNHGQLDARRQDVIASCLNELNRVVAILTDHDEAAYYNRLRELAALICDQPAPK